MRRSKEKVINIPNALSAYRIVSLTFIVYAIAVANRHLFIALISINLITDILDGLIARAFNMKTELGARLDSLADMGTFAAAISGFIFLERAFLQSHRLVFSGLMALYIIPYFISLVKFGRLQSLHLYSMKIVGYLQGIFIFTFFNFGYAQWYFYVMAVISYIAYIEEIAAVIMMKVLRSDIKTIVWLKKKKHGTV